MTDLDTRLHGLWTPGRGLQLWGRDENVFGTAAAASLGLSPGDRRLRRRAEVGVPDDGVSDAGAVRSVAFPALALAPAAAAGFLGELDPRDPSVAQDLRYLAHVQRGLDRWVRAGRVVPELYRADDEWFARWRLVGGEPQRAWLAELAAVMPPVLRGPQLTQPTVVLEDFVAELTDPLVRVRTPADVLDSPPPADPLLRALVTEEEFAGVGGPVASALEKWRESLRAGEPELVLRLVEPDDADELVLVDDAPWRLEVCLCAEGQAPVPVSLRSPDPHAIKIAVRQLSKALTAYPRLQEVPRDPDSMDLLLPVPVVTDLMTYGAEALQAAGVRVMLPRSWSASATLRLRADTPESPASSGISAVGMDQIVDYNWELALGDVVLTSTEMAQLVRANADLVRLRGEWVQADAATLAAAARYVTGQPTGPRSLGALFGELTSAAAPPVPVEEVTATGWLGALLDGAHAPEPVPAPAGLHADLRPYQQRGLEWLAYMSGLGLGAVLADDMGLGKTVQVLALLTHEREQAAGVREIGPTLLVCPMSVVGNWQREAARFVPGLRVLVHHGSGRRSGEEFVAQVAESDLVITTYALLAKDREHLCEAGFDRVVLDEAQHVKNHGTAQARAARAIPARHRIALTGTPVENRLDELRSILDFCNPGMLGSAQAFRARFVNPIEREHDPVAVSRLRAITAPFVLRRVKTDPAVISDLPDKLEMTVRANLTAEQAALYRAVVDAMLEQIKDAKGMKRKGAVLAALTRLKQVCNHPAHFHGDGSALMRRGRHRSGKLALIEDVLDGVLGDGERVLLFTQFREFGDLIVPWIRERFDLAEVPFLHGGVSKSRRDRMVEEFQSEDGPPVMVLSLKAGGTGLNLTAANHVVHLDRWWNPAVENQATDRAYRIGQRRDVQVRKLLCVGTLEERIDEMLTGKQELADLAVGVGESWMTELSTDALRDLLTLTEDAVAE